MKGMHSIARFSSEINHESSISDEYLEQSPEEVLENDNNEAPARSKRQRFAKFSFNNFIIYLVDDTHKSIMRWNQFFLIELGS